jgi:hypothetical protein
MGEISSSTVRAEESFSPMIKTSKIDVVSYVVRR